ncbi:hypothetical protein OTU49_013558, partial [Cherax quadricarinatus]
PVYRSPCDTQHLLSLRPVYLTRCDTRLPSLLKPNTVVMLMPSALPAAMPSAITTASMHPQAIEAPGISQKDTTFTKIFVGGLPYHTTDKSLREHFEVYGEIEEAVVITDRQTGKSRGYGFVTMADKTGAERAIKEPNPVIDGRKANVNLAYLGAKPRGPTAGIQLAGVRYPAMLPSQYG